MYAQGAAMPLLPIDALRAILWVLRQGRDGRLLRSPSASLRPEEEQDGWRICSSAETQQARQGVQVWSQAKGKNGEAAELEALTRPDQTGATSP